MVADSITDFEVFHGSPLSKDLAKKRKANWFCKLKQWKIDACRRQWIYQWKRSNVGEEDNGSRLNSLVTDRKTASERFSYLQEWRIDCEERSYEFTKCDDDDDETDLERTSSASSPTSVLKNKDSGSNKSGDDCFCCSKQVTEEEEEAFDDAFDNFDCFRDARNFFENEDMKGLLHETTDLEQEENSNPATSQRNNSSPETLFHEDNCKQESSSQNAKHNRRGKKKKSDQQKESDDDEISECPICSEKMDATDLSFLPCPCGFRLCLFCHNKINENDGRCPACRNKYDQTSNNREEVSLQQRDHGTLRLSRSFRGLDTE